MADDHNTVIASRVRACKLDFACRIRSLSPMTRPRNLCRILPLLLVFLCTPAHAHELWLEPADYQADSRAPVELSVRNGQDFKGTELSWFDARIARAATATEGQITPYQGRPGDLPAITVAPSDGLTTVIYASTMSKLTYDSWDLTLSFARHKDIPWFQDRHAARGLPEDDVTEGYWRYSKALIARSPGGADQDMGMETEFIALTSPADGGTDMQVRLIYQGAPRADAQVEVWDKSTTDTDPEVSKTLLRTDAKGEVTFPVAPGRAYMLDAVVLREPASPEAVAAGVMWESLWANLTFVTPER
ncbi:DUF4198 domain-containing protein [Pseudooceanicola sp. C21-150M6]|uniref:DUF4198 domain-containing protein n=1 Tax=Pseudooceanicola sp. C21-150M6 TaxID=3434355 RepID=UPI003D7F3104